MLDDVHRRIPWACRRWAAGYPQALGADAEEVTKDERMAPKRSRNGGAGPRGSNLASFAMVRLHTSSDRGSMI